MTGSAITALIILLEPSFVVSGTSHLGAANQAGPKTTTASAEILVRNATFRPLPKYPAALLRRGVEGLVVVEVHVGTDGRVEEVKVLEATDKAFGDSVTQAVRTWVITPIILARTAERLRVTSKLPFYFKILNNKGVVSVGGATRGPRVSAEQGETRRINQDEFQKLASGGQVVLIDTRRPAEYQKFGDKTALNIPFNGFIARVRQELKADALPVVDCRGNQDLGACNEVAKMLHEEGWQRVFILISPQLAELPS